MSPRQPSHPTDLATDPRDLAAARVAWHDAERTFLDDDMEQLSTDLHNSYTSLQNYIGLNTWPHDRREGLQGVPPEWKHRDPQRHMETIQTLEDLATKVVHAHQALLLEGRRRMPD